MYNCTNKRAGSPLGELLLEHFTKFTTLHEPMSRETALHAAVLKLAVVCPTAARGSIKMSTHVVVDWILHESLKYTVFC